MTPHQCCNLHVESFLSSTYQHHLLERKNKINVTERKKKEKKNNMEVKNKINPCNAKPRSLKKKVKVINLNYQKLLKLNIRGNERKDI